MHLESVLREAEEFTFVHATHLALVVSSQTLVRQLLANVSSAADAACVASKTARVTLSNVLAV